MTTPKTISEAYADAARIADQIGTHWRKDIQTTAYVIRNTIIARAAEVGEPAMTGSEMWAIKRWLIEETTPGGSIKWHCVEHELHARQLAESFGATVTPLFAIVPPAMPPLEQVIDHYGIDALCKALAPEIVREAGQPAPWTPPEDRGDGYRCLATVTATWKTNRHGDGWWIVDNCDPSISPTAFAPLPEGGQTDC